jgi:hypothetical protein
LLVQAGLFVLVINLVYAVRFEIFEREQFPEFLAARPEVVEFERERGRDFVDADEVKLGEIDEQNPFDRLRHHGDFRAETVILDVAVDLLAVLVKKVLVQTVQQALGFNEHERTFGFQEIIHRVAEDSELARVIGFGSETQSLQQGFNQALLCGLLRFLFVKPAGLEPSPFGDQGFESAKEFFFSGFGWHSARVCARAAAASICEG